MNKKIIIFSTIIVILIGSWFLYKDFSNNEKNTQTNKDIKIIENNNSEKVKNFLIKKTSYLSIYDLELKEEGDNIFLFKFLDHNEDDAYFTGKVKIINDEVSMIKNIYSVQKNFEGEADSCAPNCT